MLDRTRNTHTRGAASREPARPLLESGTDPGTLVMKKSLPSFAAACACACEGDGGMSSRPLESPLQPGRAGSGSDISAARRRSISVACKQTKHRIETKSAIAGNSTHAKRKQKRTQKERMSTQHATSPPKHCSSMEASELRSSLSLISFVSFASDPSLGFGQQGVELGNLAHLARLIEGVVRVERGLAVLERADVGAVGQVFPCLCGGFMLR